MPELTFLGAAQTVTGSKHLLTVNGARMLVDCGMFQGSKDLRQRNWAPFAFDPAGLGAVVLTHAHIDHCGMLPKLAASGFRGRIFCTPATLDLCRVVLPDAGRLQEEDARQANKHAYTRHNPALPLFTEADAYRAISQLQPLGYQRPVQVIKDVEVEFIPAGHVLGSAYALARLNGHGRTILFGGDLGRYNRPVLPDPSPVTNADVLLLESTYGDRAHAADDDGEALAQVIRTTVERRGKLIIPAFAIGRVEEILYWIKRLEDQTRIPATPVYVDSPMASEALRFYRERRSELDEELGESARDVRLFGTKRLTVTASVEASKRVTASTQPAIVISASGMATGGRVLHHLAAALPDPRHTVLFVGYQSEGTRGRQLVEGATAVKIHGRTIPVAAQITRIDSMSAHADQSEILRWLKGFSAPPSRTYLVHGELKPMTTLKQAIESTLGWRVHMPTLGERVSVD
jgi:metallo-beta-lactamase family protein